MKTNIVGIIIALILTFVGMLSVYAQDTKVSEVRKVDAFSKGGETMRVKVRSV